MQPVVAGNMVIFVEVGGKVIRELGYDYTSDTYTGEELSLFANHLFENKEIIYIAYAKAPYRLLFVVADDGSLSILTYNKYQSICGWARQETAGFFRSVAVVHEGNDDVAYFVIERLKNPIYEGEYSLLARSEENKEIYYAYNLDGITYYTREKIAKGTELFKENTFSTSYGFVTEINENRVCIGGEFTKYIERQKTRVIYDAKDSFLVDSGLQATFDTPVTRVSGLVHLANRKAIALIDGGVVKDLQVSPEGVVTLPREAKKITIGLPYEFEFETLGIESENTQGLQKQVNTVAITVLNSREDFFVVGNKGHETQFVRSQASINDSGYLYTGSKETTPLNTPATTATIHVKQKYPLPITITAVSAIVNAADISEANNN